MKWLRTVKESASLKYQTGPIEEESCLVYREIPMARRVNAEA